MVPGSQTAERYWEQPNEISAKEGFGKDEDEIEKGEAKSNVEWTKGPKVVLDAKSRRRRRTYLRSKPRFDLVSIANYRKTSTLLR